MCFRNDIDYILRARISLNLNEKKNEENVWQRMKKEWDKKKPNMEIEYACLLLR